MKLILSNAWVAFLTFFSPLFPLMLIITIAAIFDTFVGRWYARKKGEIITSGKTRRGLTTKLLLYLSVILFAFLIDKYMINDIARNYIWFDYGFTRLWTAFFIWILLASLRTTKPKRFNFSVIPLIFSVIIGLMMILIISFVLRGFQ